VYVAGVVRLRRRGDQWPTGRLVAWLLGCAALLFATSSGIGRYMPAMFSMHMAAHMLLSMLVPILLALGARPHWRCVPCPPPAATIRPGCANGCWPHCTVAGRCSSPTRWLPPSCSSRASTAGFGGLFDAAVGSHAGHVAMNIHF
jgi:putative copper resistance protein D